MATILVVDDERDTLQLLRAWLSNNRFDVLTAATGEQALQTAETRRPDLILLDVMLPDVDGITICKRLRANPATSHIPIILITAYDPAVGRVEALMAGANDYVTKPLILPDLLGRLNMLLAHDRDYMDQGQRLLQETVHMAVVIVPCNLAWLLTVDARHQMINSRAIATSESDKATLRFMQQVTPAGSDQVAPLDPSDNLLAQVAVSGAGMFNLPLSSLRERIDETIYRACASLDLYFASILPVQMVGTPLGVMVLGSRTPRDVETARGQQIMAAVAGQAAMSVHNSYLLKRLSEREAESNRERIFRQALIDTMPEGLLVYDARGTIRFANQRLKRMTGNEDRSLEGRKIEEMFADEDRHRLAPSLYQPRPQETKSLELNLLRSDGETIPVLAVQAGQGISSTGDRDERVMVLTNLSEQKAREQALARQSSRLRALNRASQAITSTLSLDDTIQTILAEAGSVLQATLASVLLRISDTDRLLYRAVVGPHAKRVTGERLAETDLLSRVIAGAQPLLQGDMHSGEGAPHPIESLTGITFHATAAAPLIVDGQVVGVVELLHELPDAFDTADLDALEGLARAAAIAITNSRLYAEARRHVREMTLMVQASETASSTLTIEHVVESISRQLMDALSVNWCMVSYWDRESDRLVHLAEVAEIVWDADEFVADLADHPGIAQMLETGEPAIISPGEMDVQMGQLGGLSRPEASTALRLPVRVGGQIVGLAKLSHLGENDTFTPPDIERCLTAMLGWSKALDGEDWTEPEHQRTLGLALLEASAAARCAICEVLPGHKRLACRYELGRIISPLGQGPEVPLSATGLRRVALVERTPVAVRVGETERLPSRAPSFPGINTGWRMLVPLVARGEAIGLVEAIDVNLNRRFSRSDLSLAQAIGAVVGNALENARLYSTLLRRAAQLEAAYNDLRKMDEHKTEWIQNVSHELRTPLTSIIGYVDLLLEGEFGALDSEQVEGIEVIRGKARHLAGLFDDILTIQRMEDSELTLEPTSLPELAQEAIEAVRPLAERGKLEIVTDFDESLPPIYLDRAHIKAAFENLLRNAVKFSPGGGQVRVSIEDRSVALRVRVSDDGIGIPPEEQEKIWWRFYQVDGSMTRQFGGTGLGLAIVKEVIEKHEGRAWVESEPGQGSTFTFVLPKLTADEVRRSSQ